MHVRVSGARFDAALVECYKNPRLRRTAIDPHRMISFYLTTGHAVPIASLWLDVVPFVQVFAAVAGVNPAVGIDGTLVVYHPARGVGHFAIRYGHAVMQLDQLRVEARRVVDGVGVAAFDARLQISDNGPPLWMRLDTAVRYTNAARMFPVTLVECDRPHPALVAALLRDHELFQSLSARFPRLWAHVQDHVLEAHVSLQFLPLAFDFVGPPVPTLFAELVCRFDGFASDLVLQLSTEFLPCPRDGHGRHRSLPMWSIKIIGVLDLVGDAPPHKLGFCAVVQGSGDMEAHLVPPRNWLVEQFAAALTGPDFLGAIKNMVPGTLTLRDVWAKNSFDLKAKVSRKDLQEVVMCEEGQRPQLALMFATKQLPLALPRLAEDHQPDALFRAPGFQLWSADMELSLFKTSGSGSWTVYGHGELVVAFNNTASLPGGVKLFDLSGTVAASVFVPLNEPREAGFASDVAMA
ncbi:hypothetical protein AMAG_19957 [Allomyces macrogynus ATCC 38327]|uniref:Uncharacterized protein n=1 Tax=Allomyces macrogynus (strain ATCC 38327) TaxID=578462 RepID=A0A0L0T304_ALLM3|nr:hypothetical protein AMAG_19957 [Allomyces macrogynus ATCC 38327]|eukprot:KNE69092.1 hypothetical protein AMAG_19957 [Allomyces macrogynus ATCC 38327]